MYAITNSRHWKEIEEIKSRLINIEILFIESEKPKKEDVKAVEEALEEYRKGKASRYTIAKVLQRLIGENKIEVRQVGPAKLHYSKQ